MVIYIIYVKFDQTELELYQMSFNLGARAKNINKTVCIHSRNDSEHKSFR